MTNKPTNQNQQNQNKVVQYPNKNSSYITTWSQRLIASICLTRAIVRFSAFHCFRTYWAASFKVAFLPSLKFHSSSIEYLPLGLYSFISFKAVTTASKTSSPQSFFNSFNFSSSSFKISREREQKRTEVGKKSAKEIITQG